MTAGKSLFAGPFPENHRWDNRGISGGILLFIWTNNSEELRRLACKKPLQNLKKSYIRHLFKVYCAIIEQENMSLDLPKKPTQKELAKIMGVTENTISRHLN